MKSTLIAMLVMAAKCFAFAQTRTVILMIEGIDVVEGGQLSAGIFTKANFPNVGKQLIGKEIDAQTASMQIVLEQVPTGTYGVAVFQDIDLNKDLKTNFLGLPQEPIGFSNDARIRFGPPSFDDAKFIVETIRTSNSKSH